MKKNTLIFVFFLMQVLVLEQAGAQVYATAETALIDTTCTGCSIQNPPYAVDANDTSFSVINLPDSIKAVGAALNLKFPSLASAGNPVGVVVEDINLSALDSTKLKGVFLTTFKNGISNGDTMCSCQFSILADASANRYKLQFNPAFDYDEIQVRLVGKTDNAINQLRIFHGFYISVTGTLPIGLSSFTAKQNGEAVDLEWQTATESNNEYFTLEKSVDGVSFSEFAKVNGQGNSSIFSSYAYIDTNPFSGLNYYRIKQTDFSGEATYFNIVFLNFVDHERKQAAGPNPCTDGTMQFNIKFPKTLISVRNASGKCVFSKCYNEPLNYVETIDAFKEGIDTGVYFITFDSEQDHFTVKEIVNAGSSSH